MYMYVYVYVCLCVCICVCICVCVFYICMCVSVLNKLYMQFYICDFIGFCKQNRIDLHKSFPICPGLWSMAKCRRSHARANSCLLQCCIPFYIVGRKNEKFSGLNQEAATVQVILMNDKFFGGAMKIYEGLV